MKKSWTREEGAMYKKLFTFTVFVPVIIHFLGMPFCDLKNCNTMTMPEMPAWAVKTLFDRISSTPTATVAGLVALLVCIGILARLYGRSSIKTNIRRYQWDTGAAGTAKKRWMWDSLKLLREGYFKVKQPSLLSGQSLYLTA